MPPDPTISIPWYAAALWAVIFVCALYALFLLLAAGFPRGWGRWRMKHPKKRPEQVKEIQPDTASERASSETDMARLSANGELEK